MNLLISACLLGVNCRYDGKSAYIKDLEILKERYHLIPICPEIFGGMGIPREPAEKIEDRVINKKGEDVTKYYEKGAKEVLKLTNLYDCKYAILKERSPSCGYEKIYDGSFTGRLIEGNGILAEMLERNGIKVIGESKVKELL